MKLDSFSGNLGGKGIKKFEVWHFVYCGLEVWIISIKVKLIMMHLVRLGSVLRIETWSRRRCIFVDCFLKDIHGISMTSGLLEITKHEMDACCITCNFQILSGILEETLELWHDNNVYHENILGKAVSRTYAYKNIPLIPVLKIQHFLVHILILMLCKKLHFCRLGPFWEIIEVFNHFFRF